jgi:PAS domain S-box-containing protein
MTAPTDSAKRLSIAGIAIVLLAALSGYILFGGDPFVVAVEENVLGFLLLVVFLALGLWIANNTAASDVIETVLQRALLGLAVGCVLTLAEAFLLVRAGAAPDLVVDLTVMGTALGGICGAVLGYYETRMRDDFRVAQLSRTALNASSDGIAVLDDDLCYLSMNDAYVALQGYADETELLGEPFRLLQLEGRRDFFEQEVLPAVEATGQWSGEVTSRRKSGEEFIKDLSVSALDNGLVCIARDVTERRRQEDRIRSLQRTTLKLSEATSVAEVGEIATEIAYDISGFEFAVVWLFDAETDQLEPLAANTSTAAFIDTLRTPDGGEVR